MAFDVSLEKSKTYEQKCSIQELNDTAPWLEACRQNELPYSVDHFLEVMNVLLEKPNLNSTHLFRADIIFDSENLIQTVRDAEHLMGTDINKDLTSYDKNVLPDLVHEQSAIPQFRGFTLQRRVLRSLIPRKPQLDKPLNQFCCIYANDFDESVGQARILVVYIPQTQLSDMPWYHPKVSKLAYLYEYSGSLSGQLSVHFAVQVNVDETRTEASARLDRTFQSLLKTTVRLLKMPRKDNDTCVELSSHNEVDFSTAPSALKDTILSQHVVQNRYSLLKQRYAADLIKRWQEKTEPSKHVFEDLSIAAFLIELWKSMYDEFSFPGFVDIACGNGVLVYILNQEGYHGCGLDARERKTWETLGLAYKGCDEKICVPKPFLDVHRQEIDSPPSKSLYNDGIFKSGTFIISNHADELTLWTPILATLADPRSPSPFLAIPCCSHRLNGSKYRYTPKDVHRSPIALGTSLNKNDYDSEDAQQPASGDLKALRKARVNATMHNDDKSMYVCLTKKTVAIARELGFDTEVTLMRIPSTRNIGIVGNRLMVKSNRADSNENVEKRAERDLADLTLRRVNAIVERECAATGGVETSAKNWIERAKRLQEGQGRGKVNWGAAKEPSAAYG